MTQVSEQAQVRFRDGRSLWIKLGMGQRITKTLMQALLLLDNLQEHVYYSGWPSTPPPAAGKPALLAHKTLSQVGECCRCSNILLRGRTYVSMGLVADSMGMVAEVLADLINHVPLIMVSDTCRALPHSRHACQSLVSQLIPRMLKQAGHLTDLAKSRRMHGLQVARGLLLQKTKPPGLPANP